MDEQSTLPQTNKHIESKYLNSLTIWYITIFFIVNWWGDLVTIFLDGKLPAFILWIDKAIVFSAFKYFMAPLIWAFVIAEIQKLFENDAPEYRLNKYLSKAWRSLWVRNGMVRIVGVSIAVAIILWTGITVMNNDLNKAKWDTSIAEQPINDFNPSN